MSVGLLIITHNNTGKSLLNTALSIMGNSCLNIEAMSIPLDCDTEKQHNKAMRMVKKLDDGEGVLVLTDLYGSTPSNIARSILGENIRLVSGVNLPMLVKILNYPKLDLDDLLHKAISGGQQGVTEIK